MIFYSSSLYSTRQVLVLWYSWYCVFPIVTENINMDANRKIACMEFALQFNGTKIPKKT